MVIKQRLRSQVNPLSQLPIFGLVSSACSLLQAIRILLS